jgi:hypothetical protein
MDVKGRTVTTLRYYHRIRLEDLRKAMKTFGILGVFAEIRNDHLSNTCPKHYNLTQFALYYVFFCIVIKACANAPRRPFQIRSSYKIISHNIRRYVNFTFEIMSLNGIEIQNGPFSRVNGNVQVYNRHAILEGYHSVVSCALNMDDLILNNFYNFSKK